MFTRGMRVETTGRGQTATWGRREGTVVGGDARSVCVQFDGLSFQDELAHDEIRPLAPARVHHTVKVWFPKVAGQRRLRKAAEMDWFEGHDRGSVVHFNYAPPSRQRPDDLRLRLPLAEIEESLARYESKGYLVRRFRDTF